MNSLQPTIVSNVPDAAPLWERYPSTEALVAARRPAEPVYCVYPELMRRAGRRFVQGFPGRVLFAVKANPKAEVVQELHTSGVRHFDTASLPEIALVRSLFDDVRCYFMAPCKLAGAAETAFHRYGVRDFVADHDTEVERLLAFADRNTTIHIRLKAFDPNSVYELSSKFGASNEDAVHLLRRVAGAGLRPGLAFNVGSLCLHSDAYVNAIANAAQVAQASGVEIASLDVGGGFPTAYPGVTPQAPEEFFAAIRAAREAADTLPADCDLMCEPGRALVAEGQSVVVQVILIKDDLVFLNDGVYGSLKEMEISNEKVVYPSNVIRLDGAASMDRRPYRISGPTCDSLDVLPMTLPLPVDLREGDWIEFGLAGAYSNAIKTQFNGFDPTAWVTIEGGDTVPPGVDTALLA